MGKITGDLSPKALAEIARDITVAALSNSKLASDGTTGTDIGKMFAAAFKEIANAET